MGKNKRSKDKKKKKEKRRKHSSSSSSNSDSNEWVEKVVEAPKVDKQEDKKATTERDEWMDFSSIIPCTSKDDLRKAREAEKQQEKSAIVQAPGQSDRESNPYWKNGGTGMPEENKSANMTMDVKWLKKSLKRAEEFAQEEGKSLEEVAAARWGSLDKIKKMIQDAENQSERSSNRRNNYDSKSYKRDRSRSRSRERRRSRERYKDDRDHARSSMRKSKDDDYSFNRNSRDSKPSFKKPSENDDDHYSSSRSSYSSNSRSSKNWKKPDFNKVTREVEDRTVRKSPSPKKEQPVQDDSDEMLTEEQMNLLGAKIVKAEIMGRHELVAQMKKRLEKARELRKHAADNKSDNVVLLTTTDNKGNMRYLSQKSETEDKSNSRKKKRVETHEQQQRVRYFADDDKYSLQDMFEKERGRSNMDDDAVFTKLMSKKNDLEEVFEEEITKESSSSKQDARERMRAIKEHKTMTKSLDNCHLCIDSDRMLKHTIVTTASKIYLSLPATSSLVPGHCILSTITHIPCQIQLDEDYCEELKDFKKKLTKLFAKQDKEPIFIETYVKRNKFPHMKVECLPLPRDEASMAPIYFKKALLECETEWAVNKKVVEFTNLQKSIPKGLPYFAVEFAMDGGFAHVIEDEMLFTQNFAHEVIGGMLDVDRNLWRKPKRENIEDVLEKIQEFQEEWNNL